MSHFASSFERSVPHHCPCCGSEDLVEDASEGNITCRDCGVVAQERLFDLSEEYRWFEDDTVDRTRVDAPPKPFLDQYSMTSVGHGKSREKTELRRAEKRAQKNLNLQKPKAIQAITEACARMDAKPHVVERAIQAFMLYRETLPKNIVSHQLPLVVAACVFVACRNTGTVWSFMDMAKIMRLTVKQIADKVKLLEAAVPALKVGTSASAAEMVPRCATRLGLANSDMIKAQALAVELQNGAYSGKTHKTIVATAICLAMKHDYRITLEDVAQVCNVALRTLKDNISAIMRSQATEDENVPQKRRDPRKRRSNRRKRHQFEAQLDGQGRPADRLRCE